MAIIIPSKNIYGDIENPKIRDNRIENISVEVVTITPNNTYNQTIYNEQLFVSNDTEEETTEQVAVTSAPRDTNDYGILGVGVKTVFKKTTIKELIIPKAQNNRVITKVYEGKNKNGNPNINISKGAVKTTITNAKVSRSFKASSLTNGTFSFDVFENLGKDEILSVSETENSNSINGFTIRLVARNQVGSDGSTPSWDNATITQAENNQNTITGEYYYISSNSTSSLLKTLTENYSSIETDLASVKVVDNGDSYSLSNLEFITERTTFFVASANNYYGASSNLPNYSFPSLLAKIEQKVSSLEISINGNALGIELATNYIPYGVGGKPISLSGSEILQETTKTNGIATSKHLSNMVLSQYSNGKETATLLCDINNYYNEDGSIAIEKSGFVKVFRIGDIVLPMVFGANGQDRPMSTYKDGTPKYFKVVGTRVFFDGAVWQELTLQEYIA